MVAHGSAGFTGYVRREDGLERLHAMLCDAVAGRLRCSPEIAASMMRALFRNGPVALPEEGGHLTPARGRGREAGRPGAVEQGSGARARPERVHHQAPRPLHPRQVRAGDSRPTDAADARWRRPGVVGGDAGRRLVSGLAKLNRACAASARPNQTLGHKLIRGFPCWAWCASISVRRLEMSSRRYELSDFEWSVIEPLLPNKPRGVPRVDDRRVLNGIYWRLRTGSPWADIPERYGPATTCYNRFVRWRREGVWDRLFAAVAAAYAGDVQMIDSSSIRVHQHGANGKKGGPQAETGDAADSRCNGRSKGRADHQDPRAGRCQRSADPAQDHAGPGP